MAKPLVINRWFVSVETPKQRRGEKGFARLTKTFPTETEAKRYVKTMIADRTKIVAGTLLTADQTIRRIISGSQLYPWVEEEDGMEGQWPGPGV